MNNMFGITGISVKFFVCTNGNTDELDDFLKEYDGNIIDIRYQQGGFAIESVMVVYKEVE